MLVTMSITRRTRMPPFLRRKCEDLYASTVTFLARLFTLCLPPALLRSNVSPCPDRYLVGVVRPGGLMWGNKKPDTPPAAQPAPSVPAASQNQVNSTPQPQPKAAPAPAILGGETAMATDAMRPMGATGDRSCARLGSSLHVKGEITGK